jgi:hypothetical protein
MKILENLVLILVLIRPLADSLCNQFRLLEV